jgi:PEP-CTERM motif
MCPMLSLANRTFLALLGTLLAFTSLPAQAEELLFDLTGAAYPADNGFAPSVGPVDVSFMLDTMSGIPSFAFGGGCLQSFGVSGASLTNVNVVVNGQSAMSLSSASAAYGGENASGSCAPGAHFFAALLIPNLTWEFDPEPSSSQAALLASNDPVATLFLGFRWGPDAANPGSGGFDGLNLDFAHLTVTDLGASPVSVPEPGTLGLLVLGLAGVALCGRKRISVRAAALFA